MLKEVFSDCFAQRKNYLTQIDARLKLFFVGIAIVVSISSHHPLLPLSIAILFLGLLLSIKIPLRIILLRLTPPLWIVTVILLFTHNIRGWSLISAKVMGAVCGVIFLGMTTSLDKLLNALRWFKMPAVWIDISLLTYRYIFVLLEELTTVRDAQRVRLGYRNLKRSLSSFGELVGSAIIKAYNQAQATYTAMLLRGYKRKL